MISLPPEFFVYLSRERRNERIVTKDWLFFYDGSSPVFLMCVSMPQKKISSYLLLQILVA